MSKDKYKKVNASLTQEEQDYWLPILLEMDREEQNNERRHRSHRADMDITIADREPEPGEAYCTADILKLSRCEDWDDIIFSQSPSDLYQLVEEYPTSAALKELSPLQEEILLENVVWGIPAKDIAERKNCGTRNITKHRQKALEKIRFLVTGEGLRNRPGEGYISSPTETLCWIIFPTFMIGWEISKRIYPRLKKAVMNRAA